MPIVLDVISGKLYSAPPVTSGAQIIGTIFDTAAAQNVSSAGNVTLTKPDAANRCVTFPVNFAVGGGAFTCNLIIATTNAIDGDVARIRFSWPASTNPTVTLRDGTAGGTLLQTYSATGNAFVQKIEASFNGTNWVLDP